MCIETKSFTIPVRVGDVYQVFGFSREEKAELQEFKHLDIPILGQIIQEAGVDDRWSRAYLLYTLGAFLCPTNRNKPSTEFLGALLHGQSFGATNSGVEFPLLSFWNKLMREQIHADKLLLRDSCFQLLIGRFAEDEYCIFKEKISRLMQEDAKFGGPVVSRGFNWPRRSVVQNKVSEDGKEDDVHVKDVEVMRGKGQKKIDVDPKKSDKETEDDDSNNHSEDSDNGPREGKMAAQDSGKNVASDDDRSSVSSLEGDDLPDVSMANKKVGDSGDDQGLSPIAMGAAPVRHVGKLNSDEIQLVKESLLAFVRVIAIGFDHHLPRTDTTSAKLGLWISNHLMHFVIEVPNAEGADDQLEECVCLSPYMMIMGPFLRNEHWWAYALDRKNKIVYVINSIRRRLISICVTIVLDYMQLRRQEQIISLVDSGHVPTDYGLHCIYTLVPRQHNSDDCGAFVYKYLQHCPPETLLPGYN
ncbi:hypothetical protein HN873_052034 [Arachis hypogaea]